MSAPENLAPQITEKTNEELLEMFKRPQDWLADALDLARAELQRRGAAALIPIPVVAANPMPDKNKKLKSAIKAVVWFIVIVLIFLSILYYLVSFIRLDSA